MYFLWIEIRLLCFIGSSSHFSPSHFKPSNIFFVYSDLDRRKSVSSILIRNFPSIFCAYNQLNSAVRAVPMWNKPVGLGANLNRFSKLFLEKTGPTGFEPATSAVTGRCSNQLNYGPKVLVLNLIRTSFLKLSDHNT